MRAKTGRVLRNNDSIDRRRIICRQRSDDNLGDNVNSRWQSKIETIRRNLDHSYRDISYRWGSSFLLLSKVQTDFSLCCVRSNEMNNLTVFIVENKEDLWKRSRYKIWFILKQNRYRRVLNNF